MTVKELIAQVKEEKPNSFSNDKLVEFINEIEADVVEYIDGFMKYEWEEYTYEDDNELIVMHPYDRMYRYYLMAKIDYALEEYQSYANNISQFNSDWIDFKDMAIRKGLVRTRLPRKIRNVF